MRRSDAAYVALALVPGIGRTRLDALLAAFGTADAVFAAGQHELRAVPGMSRAATTAVSASGPERGMQVMARAGREGGTVLVPSDPRFPPMLKAIPDAPTLLFAAGRLELLTRDAVAIVGSRAHTRYGAEVCRHFAAGLSRAGLVVVSGMARGLDAAAHRAALDVGGDTIGVLGNGLGTIYPAANRKLYEAVGRDGCLLTEFPPGERPNAGSFPRRNRLISGLTKVTVVVEARERSGALITVDCALQQGHAVLAVPGPITSPTSVGCNRLIQSGAKPALGLRDVLEEYGLAAHEQTATSIPEDLTGDERRLLDLLESGLEHADELAARVAHPVAEVLAVLTGLEIRGLVAAEPGKRYRRVAGLAGLGAS